MKTGRNIPREMRSAISRIQKEFMESHAKEGYKLRVSPKFPDMVRIELFGKHINKQRDIHIHEKPDVHKTMAFQ
jgi:hypothetical protein